MAANFLPPSKGTRLKITTDNAALYVTASISSARVLKISPSKSNTYTDWLKGDELVCTGNVLQNADGNWIEAETLRWYRKNILSAWQPVVTTAYYRTEDNTATWLSDAVTGGKPTNTGSVGGTGNSTDTPTDTPKPQQKDEDKTLQYAGLAIGATSLLLALTRR